MTILALAVFTTIVAVRRQRQALKQEAAQLAALSSRVVNKSIGQIGGSFRLGCGPDFLTS